MTKTYTRIIASVMICVPALACVQSRPTYESSWQRLLTHFSGCSSEHGYDPRSQEGLPENRLGKGELKWRACAYQGVEKIMVPSSAAPELFRKLIREDRAMTAKIAKGEMTRSKRKSRVMAFLDDIRSREGAYRKSESQRLEKRLEQIRLQQRLLDRSGVRATRRAVLGHF